MMAVGLMIAGVPGAGLLGFIALIIALRQFGALLIEADQKRLTATSCAAHGRASAPTIPQRVETMRGRKALTSTALPQRSAPLPGCPARAIGRGALLRHDSLAAETAGVTEHILAVCPDMFAQLDPADDRREDVAEHRLAVDQR